MGAARGRPGGAPPAWVWGVRGRALSDPRLPALWAGCRGPLPTGYVCGGSQAWGTVTNPTARALASWLCELWGRHEGAREGRLLPGCRPSGVGRSPNPGCPPSGRAAGAQYRLALGAGGCGRGDPSPTPQRALLRADFARCGGGTRAPGGGASCLGVGRPGSGTLPPPTASPLGGLPGPTTHWLWVRWDAGVGTRHQPQSARSCELALRAVGAARGRPGRVPPAWVWGVRGRALSHHPTAGPLGMLPGSTTHWLWVRGGAGVGTRHQPHSARSCELALRAVGAARGRPGGGCLLPGCGVSGVGRSPTPDCPPCGQAAGAHYPLAVGAGGCGLGDPSPTPQRWLLRAGFARCGGGTRAPGGGASFLGVGRPGSGALPPPNCPASGHAAGAHYPLALGAGGCGRGDPSPTPQRTLLRAGFARCGGGTRASGMGASCLGVGRPGSGALPPPTARPLDGLPGPTTHWLWVRGGAGVGTRHQPHSARSCVLWERHEGAWGGRLLPGCGASGVGRSPASDWPPSGRAAGAHYPLAVGAGGCGRGDPSPTPRRALLPACFARCGGGTRASGMGASCLGVGRPGSGALPPPTARPLDGLPGPTTHWLWVRGGAGVGTRHQPHSARSCVQWERHEGARGGRLLPGCGASGVGRSPASDCPPSGRAAGAHYPLAVGAGGCGRGDPSPTPQRALLRACFARCGGGTRAPGGGPSCLGVGRPGSGALPPPHHPSYRACGRGRLPTGLGCGVRAWGPGCPWHLFPCRGSSCVVRASGVRGTRWPLWLGTCPRAVVVAGGVPLWRASWPRVGAPLLVRSGRSRCSGRLSRRRGAFPHPAPGFTGWLRGARGGRPRTGLIVPAAGPCRGKSAGRAPRRTRSGPRD